MPARSPTPAERACCGSGLIEGVAARARLAARRRRVARRGSGTSPTTRPFRPHLTLARLRAAHRSATDDRGARRRAGRARMGGRRGDGLREPAAARRCRVHRAGDDPAAFLNGSAWSATAPSGRAPDRAGPRSSTRRGRTRRRVWPSASSTSAGRPAATTSVARGGARHPREAGERRSERAQLHVLASIGWDGEDRAGGSSAVGVPSHPRSSVGSATGPNAATVVQSGAVVAIGRMSSPTERSSSVRNNARRALFLARGAEHEEADERGDEEVVAGRARGRVIRRRGSRRAPARRAPRRSANAGGHRCASRASR